MYNLSKHLLGMFSLLRLESLTLKALQSVFRINCHQIPTSGNIWSQLSPSRTPAVRDFSPDNANLLTQNNLFHFSITDTRVHDPLAPLALTRIKNRQEHFTRHCLWILLIHCLHNFSRLLKETYLLSRNFPQFGLFSVIIHLGQFISRSPLLLYNSVHLARRLSKTLLSQNYYIYQRQPFFNQVILYKAIKASNQVFVWWLLLPSPPSSSIIL